MGWFGLGKSRTRFGKWIDDQGLSQSDVEKICGIGRNTVSRICNEDGYKPTLATVGKIVKSLKSAGYNASNNLFG